MSEWLCRIAAVLMLFVTRLALAVVVDDDTSDGFVFEAITVMNFSEVVLR